ncbi:MAG: Vitamin B12 dependent methionine synthase activation subunit [Clostridia bacterium]|nr:Vitamin B12 dependent methionine synthase activation subunit [Clostridia bacterium]
MRGIVTEFSPPPVNRKEIFRYLNAREGLESLVEECLAELLPLLSYRVCSLDFPVICKEDQVDLSFAVTDSKALAKNLAGCRTVTVFAATVGIAPDRLMARYQVLSPVKALCINAIATERIEALCDAFEQSQAPCRPRFSPGYGDLPLELQRELFAALDPQCIGLTLNESCLMSPTKSVTAILGKGNL